MLHIYQFESTIYAWSAARFRGCLAPPSRLPVPPSHSQTNSLTALKHLSGHCLGGQNLLRRQGAVPGNILSLFGADNVILALHKLHPSAAGLLMGLPPRRVCRRARSAAVPGPSRDRAARRLSPRLELACLISEPPVRHQDSSGRPQPQDAVFVPVWADVTAARRLLTEC